jgi:hypothetical protein
MRRQTSGVELADVFCFFVAFFIEEFEEFREVICYICGQKLGATVPELAAFCLDCLCEAESKSVIVVC